MLQLPESSQGECKGKVRSSVLPPSPAFYSALGSPFCLFPTRKVCSRPLVSRDRTPLGCWSQLPSACSSWLCSTLANCTFRDPALVNSNQPRCVYLYPCYKPGGVFPEVRWFMFTRTSQRYPSPSKSSQLFPILFKQGTKS